MSFNQDRKEGKMFTSAVQMYIFNLFIINLFCIFDKQDLYTRWKYQYIVNIQLFLKILIIIVFNLFYKKEFTLV